jgi:hypothetical protein
MLDSGSPLQETILAMVSGLCEQRPQRGRVPSARGESLRIGTFQNPGFILQDRLFDACNVVHQKYHRLYSTTYKIDFAQKCAFCTRFSSIQVDLQVHSFGRRKACGRVPHIWRSSIAPDVGFLPLNPPVTRT